MENDDRVSALKNGKSLIFVQSTEMCDAGRTGKILLCRARQRNQYSTFLLAYSQAVLPLPAPRLTSDPADTGLIDSAYMLWHSY